ncbi:MAG TPA: TRAP transporter substrate-binding protein [Thiomonas arsenitoxydans]|jgi:TRAP-type mannitol/chloroaromatic compound transport system substrate-binding protein|uniref:TRAP transporter substrate-binding protein n=2 Tax=Thiomonas TaxID=32012 RepID=A0A8I1SWL5_THIA3|nr:MULTISPECIES: TRAP transporter substrate-binding protein [Thiomonas]MDE1977954.1 TRAP transporter substrate-binding protein [Betaproteobacteria bacterium]MBN8744788.1 TRAP transporter substrate-binding protein [Thiomonas arsenitoxydans]MDE2267607.1 TRAP transporter substrate-binding protein [Betaproteobacteria bacterium]HML81174.1 TRAP transporter substrate-binding protein [Thiomonas arsenitoxydans]HOI66157.1 TRAP transporter substrate-binding protein [Thiomonas arsenitoxydans]
MERRSFVKHAGLAGILAAGTAPAVMAQQSVRWRLASSFPNSLDTIYGAANVFAQKVKDLTNGKFEISVHAAGELVPAFGVVDAVQQGTVECCHTAPYYFFGKDPTFALGGTVPFGFNSRQMTAWMFQGNGLKLMREFYSQYNFLNFPCGNTGAQMGGWFRKPIKSLADMKGLKMRIGGFAGKVIERIGVVPQNIPGGDIYPSLEKGTIDAAEWIGPYDDLKLGFYKVAKNYLYPGWWEGGLELDLYVNQKAYNALPADYKAAVDAATAYAHVNMQAAYDAKNPPALKELVGKGAKLQGFPKDVMEAAYKAANDLYSELSANNPNWRKVYADWVKFRNDDILWFRFAENEFDRFMSTRKLT